VFPIAWETPSWGKPSPPNLHKFAILASNGAVRLLMVM